MLLKCDVIINNRLAPGLDSKKSFATFRFSKKTTTTTTTVNKTAQDIYFTIHGSKKLEGPQYNVKGNILKVHNRFVEDGMCTVSMKEPPHNIVISKAPPENLKKFLSVLKVAFSGGSVDELINLDNAVKLKMCDLEKPRSSMTVFEKKDYPMKESFPKKLENLQLNCSLKVFDMRILKLTYLVTLDLNNNKLSALCDSLDTLSNLRNLHLAFNVFKTVPLCVCSGETATRLTLLDLSCNHEIKFLPQKLVALQNMHTLKLDFGKVEFLPANFGYLKSLKYLHLSNNQLKILPWSFSLLRLDTLDVSGNSFPSGEAIEFNTPTLSTLPRLFELCARFVIRSDVTIARGVLPRGVQDKLDTCKFCPCGNPCVTHCVPYVKSLQLKHVSQCVSYDEHLLSNKATVKLVGYLCSAQCQKLWLENPNTLFTASKQRKRKREEVEQPSS